MYFEVDYDTDHWDLREARDGAHVERVGGWSCFWFAKTDPRRKIVAQTNGLFYRVQRGISFEGTLTLGLRPLPNVEIDIIPHGTYTYGDPRWYDTIANGNGTSTYY